MLRGLIFVAVTLSAAALIGSDALGRSVGRRMPQLAAALPLAGGFDRTRAANVVLSKGFSSGLFDRADLRPADARRVEALSRAGYRAEPLNSDAVRNLALLANNDGKRGDAAKLMRVAARMTKRDLAVNIWLAGDYARRGRIDASLAMYDQGLRSSARAQELVIPAMIQSLAAAPSVEPLISLLARRPPWLADFWATAPRYVASHQKLARVRLALADRGIAVGPGADRELVEALAGSGNMAAAEELVGRLAPERAARRDAVRNAEFDRPPDFLPFDFRPLFDASLTSDLDDRAGQLRISVFGGGSGPAARQLVALPRAEYRLIAKAADWSSAQSGLAYFKVGCAEAGKAGETAPLRLEAATLSARFSKPITNCTYHWLTIYAAPPGDQGSGSLTLDRVSLVPA